jgi:hypothetical protein
VLPTIRVVAAVVTAVVLVVGTVGVVSTFFTRKHTEARTFTGTVSSVRVTADIGDVRVRAIGPGESPRVTARITESFGEARWRADLEAGVLVVEGKCGDDGFLWDCEVDLMVDVPAGIPVDVDSDTGDLSVSGAFSATDATTSTGDVAVQEAAGPVRIRTNTGDVRTVATVARVVDAETSTGDVRLSFATEPDTVTARTNTGDVRVLVPAGGTAYDVNSETDTGDVRIEVTDMPGAQRRISAETNTGDIDVEYR